MKNKRKVLLISLLVLIPLIIIGTILLLPRKNNIYKDSDIDSLSYLNLNGYSFKSKIDTYLLMGIDGKSGDPLLGQADFLTLVIVDNNTNTTKVLVIPRDTISKYPICDNLGNEISTNTSHINLAYASGGDGVYYSCINEVTAVKTLINNIPITGYIAMPLDILKDLVDIMGEKEVILEDDSLTYLNNNYEKGTSYTINKETIEEYLRSRDIDTNFSAGDRTNRQIIYMKYLMSKFEDIKDNKLSVKFEDLDNLLSKCSTNLTNTQLSNLYENITKNTNDSNIFTLPGKYEMNNMVDEYIYNQEELNELLIDIYYE